MALLNKFIYDIGFAVCHQLPSHTIFFNGRPLVVCARDTGIYFGFAVSFFYLLLAEPKKPNKFPPLHVIITACLFVLMMILDGLTSYLNLRETSNQIRLATGLMTGFALAVFVFPLLNSLACKTSSNTKVVEKKITQLFLLGTLSLSYFLFQLRVSILQSLLFYLVPLSVVFTFVMVNLLIVFLLPFWYQKIEKIKQLFLPLLFSSVMITIEFALAYLIHWYLLERAL